VWGLQKAVDISHHENLFLLCRFLGMTIKAVEEFLLFFSQLKMQLLNSLVLISTLALSALADPVPRSKSICPSGAAAVTLSSTFIGQEKNVKMDFVSCPETIKSRSELEQRQVTSNVCGAACTTNCFPGAGGGPDPNDCHIIADALRFESQNTGLTFDIGTGSNNTVVMSFSTCETFFLNQAQPAEALTYCRLDFANVIDFVAPNCQATQNAHGGNCVANDGRWFVQAQHS